jgi:uncharacterized protein (TIGR01568 family)
MSNIEWKESVALVKSSYNPYNDFKESMIEMIVEKDIQESCDLEELLQCYLSLNAVEYHALIVEVFTEVWCEIFERLHSFTKEVMHSQSPQMSL